MPHKEDAKIRILTGAYERLVLPQDKICELDLGCGTGSFSVALAANYPERHILCADVMLGRLRK
ncbi:MAG: class I SAM-dependent methyltransferase, partial [Lentisphaeria bacterium]|nr:class I SAM-dependent methyltransferase [Lentisphaeria bacterium]